MQTYEALKTLPSLRTTRIWSLEYFMKVRRLTERQVCWSLILSCYKFKLAFRPGKLADTLSRREQDIPKDASDERIQYE